MGPDKSLAIEIASALARVERSFDSSASWAGAQPSLEFIDSTVVTLIAVLRDSPSLWDEFREFVARPPERRRFLIHTLKRRRLDAERRTLNELLGANLGGQQRKALVDRLNRKDGELGRAKEWGLDFGLAFRINGRADLPLVDWLGLEALALALQADEQLWDDFRRAVEPSVSGLRRVW